MKTLASISSSPDQVSLVTSALSTWPATLAQINIHWGIITMGDKQSREAQFSWHHWCFPGLDSEVWHLVGLSTAKWSDLPSNDHYLYVDRLTTKVIRCLYHPHPPIVLTTEIPQVGLSFIVLSMSEVCHWEVMRVGYSNNANHKAIIQ